MFTLIFTNWVHAQVSMADEAMSQGIQPAFIVEVPVNDSKLVENVWKDMMKAYSGKTKRTKGSSNEQLTTEADIAAINAGQPLEIYSETESGAQGNVVHKVWFRINNEFLDKHKNQEAVDEAVKILEKFVLECKIAQTTKELEMAEKKLRQLEAEQDRLKRQNDTYHRDIENYERKIELAKQNILKNEEQQAQTAENIQLQKELLEEIRQRLTDLKNNG